MLQPSLNRLRDTWTRSKSVKSLLRFADQCRRGIDRATALNDPHDGETPHANSFGAKKHQQRPQLFPRKRLGRLANGSPCACASWYFDFQRQAGVVDHAAANRQILATVHFFGNAQRRPQSKFRHWPPWAIWRADAHLQCVTQYAGGL